MEALELDISLPLRAFDLELTLGAGRETLALVGPSGAGKTTALRCVAGLQRPARGRIAVHGRPWFDHAAKVNLPPEQRSVGLVFQEYALFPHLTVRRNVAFGGRGRADELLERLGIGHLAGERVTGISGGERQRVALARALARDPDVLLLDEPLSALDAHTRATVRDELQDVLELLPVPALLVTHDFRDAAALADRVGVIVDGRLLQLDTPEELVRRPADAFVAGFTGGNLLTGEAEPLAGGGTRVALDDGGVVHAEATASGRVGVAVYPWEVGVRTGAPGDLENALAGTVSGITPEGGRMRVRIGAVTAECAAADVERLGLHRGVRALATFSPAAVRLVPLAPGVEATAGVQAATTPAGSAAVEA